MAAVQNEFRITISPSSGRGYPVLVGAPVTFGEPTASLQIDVTSNELQEKLARIREDRASDRFLQDFGAFVFNRLLPGNLATTYELSREHAESSETAGALRMTLQVLAQELQSFPWETMYHPVHRLWLCTNWSSPLSRYVGTPAPPSARISLPLKILICASEPRDLPFPAANVEITAIQRVFERLREENVVEMRLLRHAGRASLRRSLDEFRPHMFHFIGHGSRQGQVCGLLLEKANGSVDLVPAELLLELLRQPATIRAAVLNACESDGVALCLAQQGMAAVGMQQPIRSSAAVHLCRSLYEALASGAAFDAAVNCARSAVRLECGADRRDWWLPVVFLPGGRPGLFEIEGLVKAVQVLSFPAGGRILLDGIDTGKTTTDTVIVKDDQPHHVSVALAGHEPPVPQEVAAVSGREPIRLEFVLRRQPGQVLIEADRAGVETAAIAGEGSEPEVLGPVPLPSGYARVVRGPLTRVKLAAVIGASLLLLGAVIGVVYLSLGDHSPAQVSGDAAETVLIPSGTLRRGSWDDSITARLLRRYGLDAGSALVQMVDTPERSVTLGSFFIDEYEVTNADYREFAEYIERTGDHGKCHPDEPPGKDHAPGYWNDPRLNGENQPVVGVDWYDAYAYAGWAGKRLPTDDEWEMAARGTDKRPYPWGAEYSEERYRGGAGQIAGPLPVHDLPVERPQGPRGMGGNVSEWTASVGADGETMIFRGGAWNHHPGDVYALTFLRFLAGRTIRDDDLGFRCAGYVTAAQPPAGMLRCQGVAVRLGGDDTPLLRLLRSPEVVAAGAHEALLADPPEVVNVRSFRIDKCEVTNAQYRVFLEDVRRSGDHSMCHPDQPSGKDHTPEYWNDPRFNGDDLPVVGVDWFDAYAYAAWAGKRLPTGDEWELAARGTTTRLYPWGDAFDQTRCVCEESSAAGPCSANSHPSGRSPYGVLHMCGNVWEWTADDMDAGPAKVLRGGGWNGPSAAICGLTYMRQVGAPRLHRDNDVGFRCAADVTGKD